MRPPERFLFRHGIERVVRPLTGGARNHVWLVERGGVRFVAKSTRRSAAALWWLHRLEPALREAGLRTALPIVARGRIVLEGWTLEHFISGRPAGVQDIAALRPALLHLHRLTRNIPQRPGFCAARELPRVFRSGDAVLPSRSGPLVKTLRALPQGPHGAVHAELNPSNIILTDTGPCLIDWDEARRDLALFDQAPSQHASARAAFEVASCWQVEPRRTIALARRA
ncbi:phosphotransferase [Pontivivens ytuae]|uniref:Phosphotransferase n=1 Tax=Pontivivens ytuae TaxID=2789856 RepID=A0A7S9QCM9_9RHOB|nr:phosphotransferase [Pontivivens ytuae]QPH53542.1 phosphotransferase [Pontivivens ytuae]